MRCSWISSSSSFYVCLILNVLQSPSATATTNHRHRHTIISWWTRNIKIIIMCFFFKSDGSFYEVATSWAWVSINWVSISWEFVEFGWNPTNTSTTTKTQNIPRFSFAPQNVGSVATIVHRDQTTSTSTTIVW